MTQPPGDGGAARPATQTDLELFAHLENTLYTAVVSDALDELGFRDQAMSEHLRPVGASSKLVGWARTIACMDTHHVDDDPYGTEITAIDSILPGEVVVVSTNEVMVAMILLLRCAASPGRGEQADD